MSISPFVFNTLKQLVEGVKVIAAGSGRLFAHPAHFKELPPQRLILVVSPAPESRARERRDLADAAHLGTEMVGFEIDGDAMGLEHRVQGIGDLLPDAFLHRKAPVK